MHSLGIAVVAIFALQETACTLTASGGDDGPAFITAAQTCDTVVVPADTTLSIASPMNMTDVVNTHISLEGTIKFVDDIDFWAGTAFFFDFQNSTTFWILSGENILFDGGGTIDGSGQAWYDAFASNSSLVRPIILTIYEATNVTVQDITELNSPDWFNLVHTSQNIVYDGLTIEAVSTSSVEAKNTDGWDIYRSDSVSILNSNINNGDDCVSWKPNSTNMIVANLVCNGSHGISVGSLGQYPQFFDIVENVTATNVTMSNAQNGARIKAWAGAGVGGGIVKNITFELFFETNVDNPIIIDQCYMTDEDECAANPSNTFIQDVWFNNITGTSSGAEDSTVASLSCSPDSRCSDINVNDISLAPPSSEGDATYTCQNDNVTGNAASLFGNCTTT
ncbi:glycoside hydrolase family 28 protein [Stereum hirsutum FP-91666 SS1]|uniref:glycoside hydrolase family 28 protein n=1 Tax=Stereum hirsutum (strain FP-91666) TaxID=721885 RepID=UPI000444A2A7|nr:glycoside hydrolase family 28 protein [Stereum hirsutum FP-91666 SS1]EIM85113.1 glycoside hydrolase family 28 protein [Stereum hirsutum FP-91666 SS1]